MVPHQTIQVYVHLLPSSAFQQDLFERLGAIHRPFNHAHGTIMTGTGRSMMAHRLILYSATPDIKHKYANGGTYNVSFRSHYDSCHSSITIPVPWLTNPLPTSAMTPGLCDMRISSTTFPG